MLYKLVLGIESVLIAGVLKKVLAGNRVTGVVFKGLNTHRWGISTLFVKQQVLVGQTFHLFNKAVDETAERRHFKTNGFIE